MVAGPSVFGPKGIVEQEVQQAEEDLHRKSRRRPSEATGSGESPQGP